MGALVFEADVVAAVGEVIGEIAEEKSHSKFTHICRESIHHNNPIQGEMKVPKANLLEKMGIDILAMVHRSIGKELVEAKTMLCGRKEVGRKFHKVSRRSLNVIGSSSLSLGIGGTTGEFYRALGGVLCTRHVGVDLEKFMEGRSKKGEREVFKGGKGGRIGGEKEEKGKVGEGVRTV